MKSFLGMWNVYRSFIHDYAQIAKLLTKLTGKKLPHVLSQMAPEQMGAFQYIKERLTSTSILALPRWEGHFILDTDAFTVQVGCNVLQKPPDKNVLPLGYYSRNLTPAEQNYATTDWEFSDVVWAYFRLRPYLGGAKLTIRTDHATVDAGCSTWTAPKAG